MDPMELLKRELGDDKSDDTKRRAASKLAAVARAIGASDTTSQLIPYLAEHALDQSDEVLTIMSKQLSLFVDLVGGGGNAQCLVEPLLLIAQVEETAVRIEAVNALNVVLKAMNGSGGLPPAVLEMVDQHLCKFDWFTGRVSACGIFPALLAGVGAAEKGAVIELWLELCSAKEPMVQRAAANSFGDFCSSCNDNGLVIESLIPVFYKLKDANDDSVKIAALDQCTKMSDVFAETALKGEHVLPVVTAAMESRNWKERHSIAGQFGNLTKSMGPEIFQSDLLEGYKTMLHTDPEAKVRCACVEAVSVLLSASVLDAGTLKDVLAMVHDLGTNDPDFLVREVVVKQVMALANDTKHLPVDFLQGMCEGFLDAQQDPSVQLIALKNMSTLPVDVRATVLSSNAGSMCLEVYSDENWRMREAVIKCLPAFASAVEWAEEPALLEMLTLGMFDRVATVRKSAGQAIADTAAAKGAAFSEASLVPLITDVFAKAESGDARPQGQHALGSSYQVMINAVDACRALSLAVPELGDKVLETVLKAATSTTSNVATAAAIALGPMAGSLSSGQKTAAQTTLQTLAGAEDSDTKYEASVALKQY